MVYWKEFFRRDSKIFHKFFVSYITILIISSILVTFLYFQFCRVIEQITVESYKTMLEQSAVSLDQDIVNIDSTFYTFSSNTQIDKVINSQTLYEKEKFSEIKTIYDFMPQVDTGEPKTYLIIPKQDVVISASSTFRYSLFYDYFINHEDISETLWDSIIRENHYDLLIGGSYDEDGIYRNAQNLYHVRSMPVGSRNPSAIMFTIISKERLDYFFQWTLDENCYIYVADSQGNVLYSNNQTALSNPGELSRLQMVPHQDVYLQGERYLCASYIAPNSGLRFMALTPAESVLAEAKKIQYQYLALVILSLLVALVLAILFSSNNSRPLEDIMSLLESNFSDYRPEGVNSLHAAISNLIASDKRAQKVIESNLPFIRAEQRKRLLMGELIANEGQGDVMLEDITGKVFNVLVIEIISLPVTDSLRSLLEASIIKERLRGYEKRYGHLRGYFVDLTGNVCAMLIACDEVSSTVNRQQLESYANDIFTDLTEDGKVMLKFAAGVFQDSLSDVYYSYFIAKDLLDSGIVEPNSTIIWQHAQGKDFGYHFPIQIEQRLIAAASKGNTEEIHKLMQIIYNQNFEENKIPDLMVTRLYDELNGVIFKLISQLSESLSTEITDRIIQNVQEIKKHQNILSPDRLLSAYEDTLMFIGYCVKPRQRSRSANMKPQFTAYMKEHYTDPAFGLSVLADHFDFSEIYMSQLFKENMGSTFSDYLEQLRIETACSLLRDTDLTIADISQKSGYYSPHAFRRAFKRVTGILPTDYRMLN